MHFIAQNYISISYLMTYINKYVSSRSGHLFNNINELFDIISYLMLLPFIPNALKNNLYAL